MPDYGHPIRFGTFVTRLGSTPKDLDIEPENLPLDAMALSANQTPPAERRASVAS